ncbi:transposase [Falsiroseomonas oryziterrae]|uniref:transposase n=1 Tax=Falsiroseomonas oryziterrae TaxID=2911368 RepID=UPI001F332356|nr:transposase [Roseomonas sp. NPKOSM-4]
MQPPPSFPLRSTRPTPWRPLSDAEWEALAPLLRSPTGRPPRDLRATWDGIFWIACSTLPWRALPERFGRPDSAHRALRRAAAARLLHRLLVRISPHPLVADGPLQAIGFFIARAFRRAFRIAPGGLRLAHHLGLATALPAHPRLLPDWGLSERLAAIAQQWHRAWLDRRARPQLVEMHLLTWLMERAAGTPRRWTTTG